ncbi:nucleotide-binding protein [Scatolibacter rhodanostii]|uniref:nucleotide-binding protein n=1 Tax=Scatolibacter rhodanostii TaxID=2014781 RepID=UPI000C0806E6|nr:AAA family ATPase [Scatolibacter rhodanostii]
MGISTVVTSGKGGVGKSVFSVGLGRALAARGRRVLLIDGDAGLRSLDKMTGIEENLVFDIADVMHGRCAPIDAVYPCAMAEGLFLLPAPASVELSVTANMMKQLVPLLKKYYDHVILDSPAGLGTGFRASSSEADRAVVVCNPDPICVRGTGAVRNALEKMSVDEKWLVINRFQREFFETAAVYEDLDAVIDSTGIRLLGVIPEDFGLAGAFQNGKPAKANSFGMMAISRIAARLEGDMVPVSL